MSACFGFSIKNLIFGIFFMIEVFMYHMFIESGLYNRSKTFKCLCYNGGYGWLEDLLEKNCWFSACVGYIIGT